MDGYRLGLYSRNVNAHYFSSSPFIYHHLKFIISGKLDYFNFVFLIKYII